MPAFMAGDSGKTLSISAGMNGRQKFGVAFSMPNRLILPGREIVIGLPSRMMRTS